MREGKWYTLKIQTKSKYEKYFIHFFLSTYNLVMKTIFLLNNLKNTSIVQFTKESHFVGLFKEKGSFLIQ